RRPGKLWTLVTVVTPSGSPLLLSHCPGMGPRTVPGHRENSSQPQLGNRSWGMRIRDHWGGRPRKDPTSLLKTRPHPKPAHPPSPPAWGLPGSRGHPTCHPN
uniref:Uncharacterized protein n=1 Tax=Cyanoderma ruficeps TaxID=181631 RepID=A0A8C3QTG3_9PASS